MTTTKSAQSLAHEAWDLARHARIAIPETWGRDTDSLLRFCIAARLCLCSDLYLPYSVLLGAKRGINSITIDAAVYFEFFKRATDAFYDYCHNNERQYSWAEFGTYLRFEDGGGKNLTWQMLRGLTRAVFCSVESREYHDRHFAWIQWLSLDTKVTIDNPDLQTRALDDYQSAEDEMVGWAYADVREYQDVIRCWMHWYARNDIIPKHGPGATFETGRYSTLSWKYAQMRLPRDLEIHIREEWGLPLPHAHGASSIDCRESRLICVPKTALKKRTISAEPAGLQWAQQGVRRALALAIDRSPTCRIYLQHQEYSRALALEGSICGEYGTIDLSAASDSVTTALVQQLFAPCPDVLADLLLTRSTETILPDGRIVTLSKFAPMGSATCFPVESLVFACICEAEIRAQTGRASRNGDYVVYGDDIVLRERFMEGVLRRLQELHFTVNRKKTFQGRSVAAFREACGIEALQGFDVTPLKLSRRLRVDVKGTISRCGGTVAGWIDLINRSYTYGYCTLRKLALLVVKERLGSDFFAIRRIAGDALSLSWVPSLYILTDTAFTTNYAVKSRYNPRLQRREFFCLTTEVPGRLSAKGHYDLFDWYLSHLPQLEHDVNSDPKPDSISTKVLPEEPYERSRELRLVKRWL